jgi:adenylate cyclase
MLAGLHLNNFFKELQRRNVVRVGLAYLAVAWLIIQLVGAIGPILALPAWFAKVVLTLLVAGFLITLVLAWVYELTSRGIRRTGEVDRDASLQPVRGRKLDFVIIGALLLALGYFVWESRFEENTPVAGGVESIAVLPFQDLSKAGDQQYFADGISEELLNALSRISGLKVAGRSSSFSFRSAEPDVLAIASALHVSHVLEGSVRTSGDQLRVSAQLVSGTDGFQVWSRVFEGRMEDVFQMQDELARLVVSALQSELSANESAPLASASMTSVAAYNAYLLGRFELAKHTDAGIRAAVGHFRTAIANDPEYSPAYSGLAKTFVVSPYYVQLGSPKDLFKEASELAHEAIARDEKNSEAYSVLGFISMVFERNWQAAEQQLKHSVAIHPSDASNLNLFGDYLYSVGDYLAALEVEGQAAELDPLSAANQHELALVNFFLGRNDEAIALEHLAVRLNEQFSNGWSTLARIYLFTGRDAELQQLLKLEGAHFSPSFRLWLDVLPGVSADDPAGIATRLADLAALAEKDGMPPTQVAYAYAMVGDDAKAAEWINRAYADHDPILVSPLYFFLPDDWPDLQLTRSALDRPGLSELYQLRRHFITAGSGRVGN